MKIKFTLFLILAMVWTAGRTQSLSPTVISSAGGYATSGNFSLSWTLGEIAVTTLTAGNFILTQGFQQPLVIASAIENPDFNWGVQTYPNPVHDGLWIRFSLESPADFTVEVLDLTGKKIRMENFPGIMNSQEVELDMSGLVQGIYLLKIQSEDKKVSKTVRIQKY